MSDDYVTVSVKLKARTKKAVMLSVGDTVERGAWVPRSCLHGADDKKVDEADIDDEMELRIMEWIAEREGLL